MSGKASQSKGRRGELELARFLQEYGYDVQPGRAQSYGEVPDLSGLPAVFFRRSRSPWLVVMKLEDWIQMYNSGDLHNI